MRSHRTTGTTEEWDDEKIERYNKIAWVIDEWLDSKEGTLKGDDSKILRLIAKICAGME